MRSHPHRPAAPVAGVVPLALALALLATGCEASTTPTATDDTFASVRFTLGARGDIQVAGTSRTAVTRAGDRTVTGGRAYPFDRPPGKLLVVLRHWPSGVRAARDGVRLLPPPDDATIESAYLVDTGDWALAELDGHPVQWLRRDTIRVDTTKAGAVGRTHLTLSGPRGSRPGRVTPPDARACDGVDPAVNRYVVLPEVESGAAVPEVLARLRERCLDVQYVSMPGGGHRGTVRSIEIPVAGHTAPVAELPPTDDSPAQGRLPGDKILTDPSRPTRVLVTR
ncbi:hypothetical protein AQJ46_14020 [Streptomyces canus]|uniref:Lipoprotein n=1 Tax=Streptomyces canus TaxID=58343 RepID=A0A124HZE5_9ACTN|nr:MULTISPECIES: hypothetical protein [Streptomyces]KUN70785.1 hypothetical protein AQJ46_14020 [Streptomyces canus]MDI5909637.1 hypothetical protein [Streptomyces sp. 12257]